MKTIGFFGDSYCSELKAIDGDRRLEVNWDTYIEIIRDKLSLELVHLGYLGTSIWDLLLLQLPYFLKSNTLPDICVFLWTEPSRIFNRDFRRISSNPLNYHEIENDEFRTTVKNYYKYLYDEELQRFQYKSALYYFDKEVLSLYKNKTKFVHLKSNYSLDNFNYSFSNGVTFREDLFSFFRNKQPSDGIRASNHIYGQENNELLASKIIYAIKNYRNITLSLND